MSGRTLVALSGGVDSAVAAARLASAGEEIVGVFMRNGVTADSGRSRSCCSASDARDARAVADRLGAPFYVHDMQRGFDRLIEAFARDYAAGLTPNPCMVCNQDLKFGELLTLADDLGCGSVATGHYARLRDGHLLRAADRIKDQSYLLGTLRPDQLARARFPIGDLHKSEVRDEARRAGLPVADKADSADICFVPGGDYRAVVRRRLGHLGRTGAVVDADGTRLADHAGVGAFTVGQRRGLGVALGSPAFVTDIDPSTGAVTLGPRAALERESCRVTAPCWHDVPASGAIASVQLRHHHQPEAARLDFPDGPDGAVVARFLRPSHAVTPGQYAVFYAEERVIGGGRIAPEEAT